MIEICSVKLSEELAKLGLPQETAWYWGLEQVKNFDGNKDSISYDVIHKSKVKNKADCFSAYTLRELKEWLEHEIETGHAGYWFKENLDYARCNKTGKIEVCTTEVNATAKLIIRLIKEGVIKVGGK